MATLLKCCWYLWEEKIILYFIFSGCLRASILVQSFISVLVAYETTAKQRRKVWGRMPVHPEFKGAFVIHFPCCEALPSNMRRVLNYKMHLFCAEQVYLLWGSNSPVSAQKTAAVQWEQGTFLPAAQPFKVTQCAVTMDKTDPSTSAPFKEPYTNL